MTAADQDPEAVWELMLEPNHGAWHEHRVGLFLTEAAAWQWIKDNYPAETEARYLFSVTRYPLNEGVRVPWWDPRPQ